MHLAARALDDSGRRFAVTLAPGDPPAPLSITIRYSGFAREDGNVESGTLTFVIGVREPGASQRVKPTMVTARSSARCRGGPRGRRCRFVQRGRVLRPAGRAADCTGGHVVVRALTRGKTVFRARAHTTPDCRYRVRLRFRPRALIRLRVKTRFLGTPTLKPRSAKPRTLLLLYR